MIRFILFIWLLIGGFGLSQTPTAPTEVYYEIFVRSFQDSNGDGIGDFKGVTQRLDYLADLGITGIWLMPIHPSPSYHGYDVTDFYGVNEDYGSLEDFQELLSEAHTRNIKIIIDLVVNHSSDQHPWFTKAKLQQTPYRNYYSWQETNPSWRGVSGSSAWHETQTGYYLGLFWSGMPDLNYQNPEVVNEMNKIAQFWLELGVDGFRIDAIQHIFEREDGAIRNVSETFNWLRDFEAFIKSVNSEAFLVGETWTDTQTIVKYHEDAQLDMSFNYPLYLAILDAIQSRNASDLELALEQDERFYPSSAIRATFVSNHDQVRPATSLGVLRRDERRIKLAAGLLFTLPGTPFLYYGEEIGLPNGPKDNDEAKRTPMRWDDSELAGFSTVLPWQAFSTDDPEISISNQELNDTSILNWYKQLIQLRKTSPALSQGTTELIQTDNRSVLAVQRVSQGQNLLILANLRNTDLSIELSDFGLESAKELLNGNTIEKILNLDKLSLSILELP